MTSRGLVCAVLVVLAACREERGQVEPKVTLEVIQYREVALPGFDDATVYLGDVEGGTVAKIDVIDGGRTIAGGTLRQGDELPFVSTNKPVHVLTVVSYEDDIAMDSAVLRLEQRPPSPSTLRLVRGSTTDVPGMAGVTITIDEVQSPTARITVAPARTGSHQIAIGERQTFERDGKRYALELLTLDGTGVYVRLSRR